MLFSIICSLALGALFTAFLCLVFDVEWDSDTGGDPEIVAGPFRYKIQPTQIRVGIDSTGSTYEFETVATASYAFRDDIYKIPKTLNTLGKTITEHVEDLEKKLNTER